MRAQNHPQLFTNFAGAPGTLSTVSPHSGQDISSSITIHWKRCNYASLGNILDCDIPDKQNLSTRQVLRSDNGIQTPFLWRQGRSFTLSYGLASAGRTRWSVEAGWSVVLFNWLAAVTNDQSRTVIRDDAQRLELRCLRNDTSGTLDLKLIIVLLNSTEKATNSGLYIHDSRETPACHMCVSGKKYIRHYKSIMPYAFNFLKNGAIYLFIS